jgi:hypothetical protein
MLDRLDALTRALPKGTFRTLGAKAGMYAGGPKGALVGAAIGQGIATITGRGDYVVKSNSIMSTGLAGAYERSPIDDLPQFTRGTHTVTVKHREYFGDLLVPVNPTLYNNDDYTIQPSNQSLFPWLAKIARQYQQYRIRGMVVEFKSNTTDYAAAGPLGSVGIATNYNTADAKFDNLIEFQNCEFATVSKPSHNILHAIECNPSIGRGEWLYVKDASNEDPNQVQDSRFNDFGKLQVCTSGLPGIAGQTLGQLWVSYDIEFAKPILGSSDPLPPTAAGVLVTSTPNSGVLESTTNSAQLAREWISSSITPSASTLTPVFNSLSVVSSVGNISADVVESSLVSNKLVVKRPGKYIVVYSGDCLNGATGATSYTLADISTATTASVVTFNGSSSGTFITADEGQVPHALNNNNNAYWQFKIVLTVDVTAADASNTVDLTPPQFVAHASNLVASYERKCAVYWIATTPGNYLL